MCVCVCLTKRERERDRVRVRVTEREETHGITCCCYYFVMITDLFVCVCVCRRHHPLCHICFYNYYYFSSVHTWKLWPELLLLLILLLLWTTGFPVSSLDLVFFIIAVVFVHSFYRSLSLSLKAHWHLYVPHTFGLISINKSVYSISCSVCVWVCSTTSHTVVVITVEHTHITIIFLLNLAHVYFVSYDGDRFFFHFLFVCFNFNRRRHMFCHVLLFVFWFAVCPVHQLDIYLTFLYLYSNFFWCSRWCLWNVFYFSMELTYTHINIKKNIHIYI